MSSAPSQLALTFQESSPDTSKNGQNDERADVCGLTRPDFHEVQSPANLLPKNRRETFEHEPQFEAPRAQNRMRQIWNRCRGCERWYAAPVKELNRGRRVFCSIECTAENAIATGRFRGENNPRWLGGVSNDNMRYRRRQKEREPVQERARVLVHRAVRAGRLTRLACEHCGDPKSNGHHHDYSKPLDVTWLCRSCHDAEHMRLKAAGIEIYVPPIESLAP